MAESIVDAVMVVGLDGRITLANTAACDLTGYPSDQLHAMTVDRLFGDGGALLRTSVRQRIVRSEPVQRERVPLITANGVREVELTASALTTATGELQGIVVVVRALSQPPLATLASGIGHELRNVAQVQVVAIEELRRALEQGGDVSQRAASVLPDLTRVTEHVSTHARSLLHIARGTEPPTNLPGVVDLRLVVRDTIGMLRSAGRLDGQPIKTVLPAEPLTVAVDRVRLEQVLVNLIANAADASTRGGEIEIAARAEAVRRAVCTVRDYGHGIAPDQLDAIFQPYFTTKSPERGTGLGLPVVREIVESYGGRLRVRSSSGAGTTFTFDLPLHVV